jgi:hypothetical protein
MRSSFASADARTLTWLRAVAAITMTTTPMVVQSSAFDGPEAAAAAAMPKFLARSTVAHEYRASRRLEASGSGQRAWLDVETDFTLAAGFRYEVTAEGGSGFIRGRILRSLLDEEQLLIARGGQSLVAMSTDNYEFKAEGISEEGLAVVVMRPLRKDRSLIAVRILLTPANGDLVRIEGRLAKNPSFWTSRVDVVRSYRRIGGVLMPVSLETKAQLRLLGSSALRMTYRYSHIDEQPVADIEPR